MTKHCCFLQLVIQLGLLEFEGMKRLLYTVLCEVRRLRKSWKRAWKYASMNWTRQTSLPQVYLLFVFFCGFFYINCFQKPVILLLPQATFILQGLWNIYRTVCCNFLKNSMHVDPGEMADNKNTPLRTFKLVRLTSFEWKHFIELQTQKQIFYWGQFCRWSMTSSWLLILRDGAILQNWPLMAIDRIIHEK